MTLRQKTRPLRHALLWAFLRFLFVIMALLPLVFARKLGRCFGRIAALFAFKVRRETSQHLKNAKLSATISAYDCFADLGQRAAELVLSKKVLPLVELSPDVEALIRADGSKLAACLHLGHWELMGAALAQKTEVHAIAAHRQSGPIFKFLEQKRADASIHIHTPKGGAREAANALRQGKLLLVFIDQATHERSRELPFFGQTAPTSCTFERLLALTHATPVLLWNRRQPDGRYLVECEPLPTQNALEKATARAEALIQESPEQWVWNHDRWQHR